MKVLVLLSLCALFAGTLANPVFRMRRDGKGHEFKMCVPAELIGACRDMAGASESSESARVTCVTARDRLECMRLVQQRDADFTPVDPEDMWVADGLPDEDFKLFEEIRTKEEPEAEFRYEAVAVVHKDLDISSIKDIKGLKSCHTGVGRNVGYKIPITKLRALGVLGTLNEPELSPRENELKALSDVFSKACLVGKWSVDPDINKRWKKKYSNLCALCEHPDICDYPDTFSGYDGALRCLAHNGGQIAWTKVYFVKKFFGLPVGVVKAIPTNENAEKYSYLCPDGTKKPIGNGDTPCKWSARPWAGFMTNADHASTIEELQKKLASLEKVGEEQKKAWLETILTVNDKQVIKAVNPVDLDNYLIKANYTDVIERDYGPPKKTVRFCVTSFEEQDKCRDLSKMAFSRNIRPQFDCILESDTYACMKSVRDNGADVITLDGGKVAIAQRDYNLKPIVAEQYGSLGGKYYAVAVIKKDSKYQSFEDLRGAKSCHTGIGRTAGYNAPLFTLLKLGLVGKTDCPYPKALSNFFSGGSCLPGALLPENNVDSENPEKLCSLCVGNVDGKNSKESKCAFDAAEAYSGYTGAFRCLVEGAGDVAFVKHVTVSGNSDGKNKDKWAIHVRSSDYELLCPNGGRATIEQYETCNLAVAPPHMVVTSNSKNNKEIEEIQHAILDAGQLFSKRQDLFKMFGSYKGKKDLLFKDSATGLVSADDETSVQKEYSKLIKEVHACDVVH